MHALFTSPASFKRYIAIAPSSFGTELLFREQETLVDASVRLFLGASGELPPGAGTPESTVAKFDDQFKSHVRPGLRYTVKVFSDETHNSVVPAAMMTGLRAVFDPPRVTFFGAPPNARGTVPPP
jgi:predicted alpha/beta superfamily hydrolase